jgi:N-ethylmaleimide reductase
LYDALIAELHRLDLGYLHAVTAEVSGNVTIAAAERQKVADVLGFVRPRWRRTLIAAGNFDLARGQAAIRDARADLVAFGRDFISNPDLVTRLRHGHPLARRDPTEWYGAGAEGYTDYPRWGATPSAGAAAQLEGAG